VSEVKGQTWNIPILRNISNSPYAVREIYLAISGDMNVALRTNCVTSVSNLKENIPAKFDGDVYFIVPLDPKQASLLFAFAPPEPYELHC
jgi:hypothetical protein